MSMEKHWSSLRGVSRRRRALLLIAVIVALSMSVFASGSLYLLYQERLSRFPALDAGIYSGVISGLNTNEYFPFIIERAEGQNSITFIVDAPGHAPATLLLVSNGERFVLPLLYTTPDGDYVLSGSADDNDHFSGIVKTQTGLTLGEWALTKLSTIALPQPQHIELTARVDKIVLHQEMQQRLSVLSEEIPSQEEELRKLSDFLTQTQLLKTRAQSKLVHAQQEESRLQEIVAKKVKQLNKSYRGLKAAERVTAEGRLVTLGRLGLEREAFLLKQMRILSEAPIEVASRQEVAR